MTRSPGAKDALRFLPHSENLAKTAQSDPKAFGAFYAQEFSRIYNYIRYRVRDANSADELTAQTFTEALERLSSYDADKGSSTTWLLAIARNSINDQMRAKRIWKWVPLEHLWHSRAEQPNPEELLVAADQRGRLLAAIARLTDRERDILGLKFAGQQSNRAIARLMGLKESHVGVLVFRAIGKLRVELRVQEVDHA